MSWLARVVLAFIAPSLTLRRDLAGTQTVWSLWVWNETLTLGAKSGVR